MEVDQNFLDSLEHSLSSERLDAYRAYFNVLDDTEAYGAYMWNKSVGSAFYPLLQAVEISFRNAVYGAGTKLFSGNREWFRSNKIMSRSAYKTIKYKYGDDQPKRDTAGNLVRQRGKVQTTYVPFEPTPSAASVVAGLTFGFWVQLCTRHYDDSVTNSSLWPRGIPIAFPNAKGVDATRGSIHKRFNFIKGFRNRVGHHEPLWKIKDSFDGGGQLIRQGPTTPEQSIVRLNEYIDLMEGALKWMSLDRAKFVKEAGYIAHLRSVCSMQALDMYMKRSTDPVLLHSLHSQMQRQLESLGNPSGTYLITIPERDPVKETRFVLDVRAVKLPQT